jgi:hypothetical protein
MDNLLPLLLIGIMYLVSALWRRIVSKNYTQLHLPEQVIAPKIGTEESTLASGVHIDDLQVPIVTHFAQNISNIEEEPSVWQGKLTEDTVINGLIFSEILLPPRAYRPFITRK